MKIFNKVSVIVFVALIFALAGPSAADAAGPADNFTVLANAAVTCTDGTIIGDVGTFQATPTGSVTQTTCPITGTVHVGDGDAVAAFNDFLGMYNDLAPQPGDCDLAHTLLSTIPASVTLAPGTYCTEAALTATDVTLTLDAAGDPDATWLFKIGTITPGALTGTNFSVVLANGAQSCNVTWWVDAAATISTTTIPGTTFAGNILGGAAITTTGGTLMGNAWAQADVTITRTVVTGCEGQAPTTGSLTVQKDTIGSDGTFTFSSDIPGNSSFSITTANNTGSQTLGGLTPGVYHVTENTSYGWTMTDTECAEVTVIAGINSTCTVTNTKNKLLGEIRGTKYEDCDGDGKLNENNKDNADYNYNDKYKDKDKDDDKDCHALSGWTIYLDTNNNGVLDVGEPSTVTDKNGNYRFSNLPAGIYRVREVLKVGWIQTVPSGGSYTIVLAAGQIAKYKNFGNFKLGSISGMKFKDANGNGRKDRGEVGLSGWTIKLMKVNSSAVIASAVTDSNGNYSFGNLGPGTYKVREVQQSGWVQTTKNPSDIKVRSGTVSKNNNFGNHFGPVKKDKKDKDKEKDHHDGDHDNDDDDNGHDGHDDDNNDHRN